MFNSRYSQGKQRKAWILAISIPLSCVALLALLVLEGGQPQVIQAQRPASDAPVPTGDRATAAATGRTTTDHQNIELLSHIGGRASDVFVEAGYAYVGVGPELAVLDIADPAHPTRVGYVMLPDSVTDVAVAGGYAYVAAGREGMRVVDVSNPTVPIEIGFYDNDSYGNYSWGYFVRGVTAAHGIAYVAWGGCGRASICGGGLDVLDVSNPATPMWVGSHSMEVPYSGAIPAQDVEVVGGYAYVAGSGAHDLYNEALVEGLWILDVSDPAAPAEVGFYETPQPSTDVAVAEGYAYVTLWGGGLRVVDVSNPAAPFEAGVYDLMGRAYGVAVVGDYAYVACGVWDGSNWIGGGLQVVDVSNPAAPAGAGTYTYTTPGIGVDVAVAGGTAYLAAGDEGLRAVDVSAPTVPVEVGAYAPPGSVSDIALAGGYAYLAAGDLWVMDVSDSVAPVEVGAYALPGSAQGVAVAGDYACVAGGESGLWVVDISDPTTPIEVGTYSPPTDTVDVVDVAIAGSYAYLAAHEGGLRVVDISDPTAPTEVGYYDPSGYDWYTWDVAVAGGYAYINYGGHLRVVDVSDPTVPVEVGAYAPPGSVSDIALAGGYAYVTWQWFYFLGSYGGLDVVDVSDPTAPTKVGVYACVPAGVAVADGYAYVADQGTGSLCIVDVRDAATSVDLGCRDIMSTWSDAHVAIADGTIYVAGDEGLFILRERFSITGQVADGIDRPSSGVTVSTNSGLSVVTDESGVYTFTNLLHGTLTLTPTLTGYIFWPATRTVTLGPDATRQDFSILPGPVSVTLTVSPTVPPGTASLPARLVYTDAQGLLTQVNFSAGAVTRTTTLVLMPTLPTWGVPGFAFAGHAFKLEALWDGSPSPDLTFTVPVTVTIQYSDRDVKLVTDENQLALWWLAGGEWRYATQTCDPASAYLYIRDGTNNVLGVPICRPGLFGLFGPTRRTYLPLILYNR